MHLIDWLIMIIPLAICATIAIYSRKFVRSVADFMAGGNQVPDERRADKTCSACNQDLHFFRRLAGAIGGRKRTCGPGNPYGTYCWDVLLAARIF